MSYSDSSVTEGSILTSMLSGCPMPPAAPRTATLPAWHAVRERAEAEEAEEDERRAPAAVRTARDGPLSMFGRLATAVIAVRSLSLARTLSLA